MNDDAPEPFAIAEIELAGGGRLGLARLPGRTGQLAADVEAIALWGANLVVSMTEAAEMTRHGAGELPQALAQHGIPHHHFAVPDFGAPAESDARWKPLSEVLRLNLRKGGSVLLHCMGGKGRSGMVAMRVLAEHGTPPETALEIVRKARPGAVETDAQAAWAACGSKGRA
ncbi:MAG: tyrosine-protein phosphatase [Methylobacterium sp.]|nr:tyrosine-protein phosphatase [Methylobacterium sp.]